MPQKTKKAKMAAEQRRALKYTLIENTDSSTSKEVLKKKRPEVIQPTDTVSMKNFIYDLRKSLILIVIILGLEFAMYFVRISNYFLN